MRANRLSAALVALTLACTREPPPLPGVDLTAYRDTIATFQNETRAKAIAGPTGWATLVSLAWLRDGENRVGTNSTFEVPLPADRAPARLGTVIIEGDSARFVAAPGATVTADSQPVVSLRLHSDLEAKQTVLAAGSLLLYYIERGGRRAIRVKDTLSAVRKDFPPLRYFPVDTAWRITAHFVPRATPDSMDIIDVLGIQTRMWWPGALRFRVKGREYTLQVIREPEDHSKRLLVMFKDSTNLNETYPAMRYTYVDQPDSLGRTILDFNRSYNPPCAFTSFATCPLPPPGNTLPLRIPAGELRPPPHERAIRAGGT